MINGCRAARNTRGERQPIEAGHPSTPGITQHRPPV